MCQYDNNDWAWWLNIGVQIFFILSGFLYGGKRIERPLEWIGKQFKKILIPYYTFLLLAVLLYVAFSPEALSPRNVVEAFFCVGVIEGIGHLWFVGYILICYLITPCLQSIVSDLHNKDFGKSLLFILGLLAVYSVVGICTHSYFRPGRILCYVVGYLVASYYQHYGNRTIYVGLILSFVLAVVSNSVFCYLKYAMRWDMMGPLVHLTDYSRLFLGLFMTLALLVAFRSMGEHGVLKASDKISYEIYLVHQLFILSPFTLMSISGHWAVNLVTVLMAICTSGYVLRRISHDFIQSRLCKTQL